MYAVFQSGGKQHRVREGQIVRLERLNISAGETFNFYKILMIVDNDRMWIGTPFIEGGIIASEVISHGRSKKIKIVKFRRRKHYRKQQGHRQWFTDVKIISISIE